MTIKFDHILMRVDNLKETVNDFQKMGFNVYYGNSKKKCHHAMVYFENGSFIEFIDQNAFPSILKFFAKSKILNLFGPFFKRVEIYTLSRNRFLDYSLYCSTIKLLYEQTKAKTQVSKLMSLKRTTHLKEKIQWQLFSFDDMELPFIMSDYYPRKYPDSNSFNHQNGVIGITEIQIKSKSADDLILKFGALFDLKKSIGRTIELENTRLEISQGDKFEIISITLKTGDSQVNKIEYSTLSKYSIKILGK
ncbi:hypothetical protein KU06062659_1390001 [Flavobacterium psychrophilum]|uniref:VOC family protein n=1 Tax=Flavobacterium psychrophilum TaxID=96345 RepID=UPI000B7C2162|nr:VOC family protein [Flavobacterium psychrophilum]SNB07807.1 hypothetical protein KU06062659_1390001 [Flavobacterium psychrophilum]